MKKAWENFIKSFQPTYSVNAITYFVVPGIPVNKSENRHDFDKGEYDEAKVFFDKVSKKTKDLGFSPAEVQLIKGKKTIVEKQVFGAVDILKDMPTTVSA
ncbi:MAG: hypothetical protein ACI8QD_002113 [Cyclobacteriaceae bacterium]|jgi:hypothetical protein